MIKDIPISSLILDTENYRLGVQVGQSGTVKAMIAEQGEKLVNLAKDIVENGLSPIELIAVAPVD